MRLRRGRSFSSPPRAPLRFWPDRPRRGRRSTGTARTLLLAATLLLVWPTLDPALIEPPAFLSAAPERVAGRFTLCREERTAKCVVDGDTFRLGRRRIRIVGIDAPEVAGQCQAERDLAARSTAKLRSLLNEGPFIMTARIDDMTDRYGRELRTLWRARADGSRQSIAADMRSAGLAARYIGRKASWC
ncbi:MAG TPA: thermonuclease family protein [Sphingomicrobium sp.]|nr:thermonuclease family protein [Sphingomicrobium sp.]